MAMMNHAGNGPEIGHNQIRGDITTVCCPDTDLFTIVGQILGLTTV